MNISEQIVVREIESETIIINLANGEMSVLDSIGTAFWKVINGDSTEEGLKDMMREYDVEYAKLYSDFQVFVSELKGRGIIC